MSHRTRHHHARPEPESKTVPILVGAAIGLALLTFIVWWMIVV